MIVKVDEWMAWMLGGIFSLLGTFFIWFFKSTHSEHKEMYKGYIKNRGTDLGKLTNDMSTLSAKVERNHNESEIYRNEQRKIVKLNQDALIKELKHTTGNIKTSNSGIAKMFELHADRFDKLENRLNDHLDNGG